MKTIDNKLLKAAFVLILAFGLASCSKNDNPVDSNMGSSTVSGRITTSDGLPKSPAKASTVQATQGGVQGATVILAQVQADGSLKTVSTNAVQTDAAGKFTVNTNLSGVNNIIVVANQGSTEWKARVSSTLQSGTTVYAPPLNTKSTTEADLYIKIVSQSHAQDVDESDLKLLMDSDVAAQIKGDDNAQAQIINAMAAKYQATSQAAVNSYFGFSNSQMQAMASARANAKAKLDQALYASGDSDDETDNDVNDYEGTVIAASSSSNISASSYAELMRIGLTAFINATSSMSAQAKFAVAKSFSKRYAFVLSYAMQEQFTAAGASNAQINAVSSAGNTLYASIKSSTDVSQITDAYVQYRSSIQSELKLTLSAYASIIDSINTTINTGAKTTLVSITSSGASFSSLVNAYITFFTSIKSSTQASFTGASSAQVNAASQILILANMN